MNRSSYTDRIRRLAAIAAVAWLMTECIVAEAQDAAGAAAQIDPVSQAQSIRIGKTKVTYRITWSSLVLQDDSGAAAATISATSYVRTGVPNSSARPVLFAFNGGPGASSTPLHFNLLGPKRRVDESPETKKAAKPWVDNAESLIDVADLVLIDPVGTGYSREILAGAGRHYWNVAGDGDATLKFIRNWLTQNGRTGSPLFVAGESYGGTRLAQIAKDIGDLNVAGLILISPAIDYGAVMGAGNDQPYIFELPTMAATALAHGKIAADGRSVEQVWNEAREFAQTDYAAALQQGSTLPADQRAKIAKRIADLVGVSPELIEQSNLRLDSQVFLESLVPGQVVGRIDTRVAAPKPEKHSDPSRPAAADDPALGMIGTNIKKSAFAKIYLQDQAGLDTSLDYYALRLDLAMGWDWFGSAPRDLSREDVLPFRSYYNLTPNIATLMNKRSAVKVFLMGGYYDLATPLLGPRYALTHSGVPMDRVTLLTLESGHTPFNEDANRKRVSEALHRFVGMAADQGIALTLTPIADRGDVTAVRVSETVTGLAGTADQPLFQVPVRVTTVMGQVYLEGDVTATDASGPLTLKVSEEPDVEGVPVRWRTFRPSRNTVGPLKLRYQADVVAAERPRKPGPSYDLRGTHGGFGGAFFSFLLLPTTPTDRIDLRLHWDLSRLPAGSLGVTSRGEGDVSQGIPAAEITTIFLLGGAVHGYSPHNSQFHAYWIGQPPFDAESNSQWTAKSFAVLHDFFRDPDNRPFYLLMRPFPLPRDGGGATRNGFMLEYGVGELPEVARRFMFTHEMVHHFQGSMTGPSGEIAWYGEGMAEFYKVQILRRADLVDPASYVTEVNTMTNAYYLNPSNELTNAEVAQRRWTDRTAQAIPYNRGFMYFADLNAKIRAASGGQHSVDDLVLAMLASERAGKPHDEGKWRELVREALGQTGVDDFDHMLAGQLIVPPADAFGPELQRHERVVARPALGFDENSLLVKPYVISGLDGSSGAAQAGLQDGDEVTAFTGARAHIRHSARNLDLDPTLILEIRRNGSARRISFSTEGPSVKEYYWAFAHRP